MTDNDKDLKSLEQKTKTLLEIIKRIDSYIASTNTKCTIIMSYCAAVIGITSLLIARISPKIDSPAFMVLISICAISILISSTYCIYKSIMIIFPVTFSSIKSQTGDSIFFFGDISMQADGEDGYRKKINSVTEKEIIEDLSGQIFTISTIASKKFSQIKILSTVLIIFNVVPTGVLLVSSAIYFLAKRGLF